MWYSELQFKAVMCSPLQFAKIMCNILQGYSVLDYTHKCGVVDHAVQFAVLLIGVKCCAMLFSVVLYNIAKEFTVLYRAV